MITLTKVLKQYEGRTVLDIPSLTFNQGERCALIGPNGSGKSTLIKLLSGVLRPDEGVLEWAGAKPDTAYLPQCPYAFDLPVWKNASLGLPSGKNKKELALSALARVGLTELSNARGSRLSGGEAQRMALARVLAAPHQLLVLDEPTSATDISAGDRIEQALLEYLTQWGCTLVFSSHSPAQALRLSDRVLLLEGGNLVEDGPPEQVLHSPRSESGRKFLQHWRI